MAQSKSYIDSMAEILECGICMNLLNNPKRLNCPHQYCKDCLDDMLEFNIDGSGSLTCPLRCTGEIIYIGKEETTSKLLADCQFKNVIEIHKHVIESQKPPNDHPLCGRRGDCMKKVSLYCPTCDTFCCTLCKCGSEGHKNAYITLQFSEKENQLMAKCEKHDAVSKFVCEDKLICRYCRHRDHSQHQFEPLNTYVSRIRHVMSNEEGIKRNMENAKKHLDMTMSSCKEFRESLSGILKKRKLEYIYKHICIAENHEKMLLDQFDNIVNTHTELYPDIRHSILLTDARAMKDTEVFVRKETILNEVIRFAAALPTINISISKTADVHPLGELNVVQSGNVKINNRDITSSISSSIISNEVIENMSNMIEKLNSILNDLQSTSGQVAVSECMQKNCDKSVRLWPYPQLQAEPEVSREANSPCVDNSELTEALATFDSKINDAQRYDYLIYLCAQKKDGVLTNLAKRRNNVAKVTSRHGETILHLSSHYRCMELLTYLLNSNSVNVNTKGSGGRTPLHMAVLCNNVDAVKLIIQNKCDINITDAYGSTPLAVARRNNNTEIIRILLEA